MRKSLLKTISIVVFISLLLFYCSKSSNNNNSNNNLNTGTSSVIFRGVLVGSTGFMNINLQGSNLQGANHSYILVTYIDSSKTPVYVLKDSLTTSSLTNWQPGTAISNAIFSGSTGIAVTLVSVDAGGTNTVTSMSVPNDPHVKTFISKQTITNTPLLVYIGKAVPVGNGIANGGGNCKCNTKTINFIINPAYAGSTYAAANAIYIDSVTHWAGFLNAQILSSNTNQLTQIINNNDTAGLHVNNGAGGPNSNNGSGPVTGTLQISSDGSNLTGNISGMYIPSYTTSSCSCSYTISATKVQ